MEFRTIWTNTGLLKLAKKVAAGEKLNITHAAVGDGGKDDGTGDYEPSMAQTALVRERYRAEIISAIISESDSHKVYFCFAIPAQVGGFYIHEAGLFDEDGDLIAISGIPMSYKTVASEGATNDLKLKIGTLFASTDQIKLEFNPSVSYVDFEDLEAVKREIKDYTDAQVTEIKQTVGSGVVVFAGPSEPITGLAEYVWMQTISSRQTDGTDAIMLKTSAEQAGGYHVEVDQQREHIDNALPSEQAQQAKASDIIIMEV